MAQAIAAEASLALAVKLKKIFEKEDKFLTFPTGLGFSYDYLEFMGDPYKTSLSAQEQLNFKADFSREMNFIPEDKPSFIPDSSRFLWDELEHILNDSIFAKSALTQDEERQLAEAIDFLTDDLVDSDGSKVPVNSPQVSEYYKYKTLCEEAERTYLDEKFSIEFDKGPDSQKLLEIWNAYREKQLKDAWDKAMQDWINLGFKRQVEQYQAQKNSLELRKYLNLYRQKCLEELAISEIPDLNGRGIGFFNSFFSPADAFNKNLPWTSVTLTKSEIVGLIKEAPQALKIIFGVEQGNVDIEAISLEYNNVIVIRPWFKPEFFRSRYWKLPDDRVISDGQVPCNGILPAFITSIIVARNVQIIRRKGVAQNPVVLPLLSNVPVQKLKLSKLPVVKPQPINRTPMTVFAKPVVPVRSMTSSRSSFARLNVPAATLRPLATSNKAPDRQTAKHKIFYANTKFSGMTIRISSGRLPTPQRINRTDFRLPAQNSQLVTENINLDGVSVLALVCKRVPKSPYPELSLQW